MNELSYQLILSILKSNAKEQVEIFEYEGKTEINRILSGKEVTENNSEGSNSLGIPETEILSWISITYSTIEFLLNLSDYINKNESDKNLEEKFYNELLKHNIEPQLAKKISKKHTKIAVKLFKSNSK